MELLSSNYISKVWPINIIKAKNNISKFFFLKHYKDLLTNMIFLMIYSKKQLKA